MTKYEVGVVTANPIHAIWKQILTILRTWRHAKTHDLPSNRWYGVYETGTEVVVAQMGCLPGARERAEQLTDQLNRGAVATICVRCRFVGNEAACRIGKLGVEGVITSCVKFAP